MSAMNITRSVYTSHHIQERNNFQVGETASLSKKMSKRDIQAFAALTGDINPFHLDEEYARETPFKSCIAHGMLIAGFISAALGTQLPGPGAIYISQQLRFTAPVRAGDTVTVVVQVSA